jgi:hypothetical protein
MVNGYKMVPQSTTMRQATTYQKRAVVEQSPMITWGKIEGTMFLGMEKSCSFVLCFFYNKAT